MNKQDTLQDISKKTGDFIRNSATIKVLFIGFLVAVLLIPTFMITALMTERASRRDSVVQEINQKWGNSQTITGPFFCVPFKSFHTDKNGESKASIRYVNILPERLNVSGQIDPEIRYRSIYEAVLYNIEININGNFTIPKLNQSFIPSENVLWEKAVFSIGISDMKGIQDNIIIEFNDKKFKADPGLKTTNIASSGVGCIIPLSPAEKENSFSLKLN